MGIAFPPFLYLKEIAEGSPLQARLAPPLSLTREKTLDAEKAKQGTGDGEL